LKTLSRKSKYALRALYCLTREYANGPVLIARMAEQEKIPRKFLEAILVQLRNSGVVNSRKGRGGGYVLAIPPGQVTIGSIIRIIDGPLAPLPCASESAFRRCEECPDTGPCGTRRVMRQVRDAIAGILDHTTLASVCEERAAAEAELTYEI
jgi:Rrf2 family protein